MKRTRCAGSGLIAGLAAAAAASRITAELLSGISPFDPLSYAGAAILLGAAILAASLLPAFRAGRADPLRRLRSD
jgi:putative ABC transport system permease protein